MWWKIILTALVIIGLFGIYALVMHLMVKEMFNKKEKEDKQTDDFVELVGRYVKAFSKVLDETTPKDRKNTMKVLSALCGHGEAECGAPYKDSLDCRFCSKKDTICCDRYWD